MAPALQLNAESDTFATSSMSSNLLLDEALARINTPQLTQAYARMQETQDIQNHLPDPELNQM
jgi:hypothetical protein